jgi:hypothetical protein
MRELEKIRNEKQLLERFSSDIKSIKNRNVAILAGHFPLRVDKKSGLLQEDFDCWGDFTLYTLELGAKVGKLAEKNGKNVYFIFMCDDHSYRDEDKKFLKNSKNLTDSQLDNRWRAQRYSLYRRLSKKESKLPEKFTRILSKYGFGLDNIMLHNHGKKGRGKCLYFSETVLRDIKKSDRNLISERANACSREYVALLKSKDFLFNKKTPFLIGFIPNKCSHFICDVVDFFIKDFKGIHIFMNTGKNITRKNVYKGKNTAYYKADA